jgi:hypothetical protein
LNAKNAKNYSARCELVVYIGFSDYGIRRAEVEAEIAKHKRDLCGNFDAVHIIWDDRLY